MLVTFIFHNKIPISPRRIELHVFCYFLQRLCWTVSLYMCFFFCRVHSNTSDFIYNTPAKIHNNVMFCSYHYWTVNFYMWPFFCRVDSNTTDFIYNQPKFIELYEMLLKVFLLFCFKCKAEKLEMSMN